MTSSRTPCSRTKSRVEAFFAVLRQWFERYNGQSVTTDQFEALAAEVSKTDLSGFFAAWVHSTIVPPLPG